MATILVVDDEPHVTMVMRDILEIEGYQVVEAHDGPEGLAALNSSPIDLVILDINMPGEDGLAVLEAVRADPATAERPVIVYTAYSVYTAALRDGYGPRADAAIIKSSDPQELLDAVARLLDGTGGER